MSLLKTFFTKIYSLRLNFWLISGLVFLLCLLGVFLVIKSAQAVEGVSTFIAKPAKPYFIFPAYTGQYVPQAFPFIKGETGNNTIIEIYIDGTKDGQAAVVDGDLYTAYFTYRPRKPLRSGIHSVSAVARSRQDATLKTISDTIAFITTPYPAPTLFPPQVRDDESIYIVGLARNDSLIKLYFDGQLKTEFKVKNDFSGTANFFYRVLIPKELPLGRYAVFATATDAEGKESLNSNLLDFTILENEFKKSIPISTLASKTHSLKPEPISAEPISNAEAVTLVDEPVVDEVLSKEDPAVEDLSGTVHQDSSVSPSDISETSETKTENPAVIGLLSELITVESPVELIDYRFKRTRNIIIGVAVALVLVIIYLIRFVYHKKRYLEKKIESLKLENRLGSPASQPTLWQASESNSEISDKPLPSALEIAQKFSPESSASKFSPEVPSEDRPNHREED